MTYKQPHIILITIDSLRADFLPFEKAISLVPRSLRKNAVYFENCIAAGPYTWASIPSIFTAQSPLIHNFGKDFRIPNIIDVLKNLGYETIAISTSLGIKYLLRNVYARFNKVIDTYTSTPLSSRGRLVRKLLMSNLKREIFKRTTGYIGNIKILIEYMNWGITTVLYSLDIKEKPYTEFTYVADKALNLIKGISQPCFLWIHAMDIHEPYPKSVIKQYFGIAEYIELIINLMLYTLSKSKKTNEYITVSNELKHKIIKLYRASVYKFYLDLKEFLYRLFEEVSSRDIYIILTADHGEELFDHGAYGHLGMLTQDGFVTHLYNELLHVPLIIIGNNINGSYVRSITSHYDIAPTILSFASKKVSDSFMKYSMGRKLLTNVNTFTFVPVFDKKERNIVSESQALITSTVETSGVGSAFAITRSCTKGVIKFIWNPISGTELELITDVNINNGLSKELMKSFQQYLINYINNLSKLKIKLKALKASSNIRKALNA